MTGTAPKPVTDMSNEQSADAPVQVQRLWTTDRLFREADYCAEGGESQEPGKVPGPPGTESLEECFVVGESLTVITATLKLRETTMPF